MLTLLDANILEDIARRREGWQASYTTLITLRREGQGCVSAWTVVVFRYFRRALGQWHANQETLKIVQGLAILDLSAAAVQAALVDKTLPDFEDALQFHVAKSSGCRAIVTRNIRHFEAVRSKVLIATPEEYLRHLNIAGNEGV
jgi:predicted nucleic acid-binding protein